MTAEHEDHGNTPAAWTAVAIITLAFVIGTVAVVQANTNNVSSATLRLPDLTVMNFSTMAVAVSGLPPLSWMSSVSLWSGEVSTVLEFTCTVTPAQTTVTFVGEVRTTLSMGPSMESGAMAARLRVPYSLFKDTRRHRCKRLFP